MQHDSDQKAMLKDLRTFKAMLKDLEGVSLDRIAGDLRQAAANLDAPDGLEAAALLMSMYMAKLQQKYPDDLVRLYPDALLPLPKEMLKKIGFLYAESIVRGQRGLMRYQEEAALFHTRFQPMTERQWDEICTGVAADMAVYELDVREKGRSDIPIPEEYRELLDTKEAEYVNAARELHDHLRARGTRNVGCLGLLLSVGTIVLLDRCMHSC